MFHSIKDSSRFWKLLAQSGIGFWVKPAPLKQGGPIYVLGETDPAIEEVQRLLARSGYGVAATGYLETTRQRKIEIRELEEERE
jgi:N-acetyl-anhydromuramyl-L-alanine amidase AmpD